MLDLRLGKISSRTKIILENLNSDFLEVINTHYQSVAVNNSICDKRNNEILLGLNAVTVNAVDINFSEEESCGLVREVSIAEGSVLVFVTTWVSGKKIESGTLARVLKINLPRILIETLSLKTNFTEWIEAVNQFEMNGSVTKWSRTQFPVKLGLWTSPFRVQLSAATSTLKEYSLIIMVLDFPEVWCMDPYVRLRVSNLSATLDKNFLRISAVD